MSEVKSNQKTYYPHVVVGMIFGCIIACGYTIKIAIDNPVEMDTSYMQKYQQVDQNINQLLELQEKFSAQFDLGYSTETFVMGQNTLTLKLTNKKGEAINNASIVMMLSRPDSNKDNKEFKPTSINNGEYTFGPFDISKPGRWQILSKIEVGAFKGYLKNEAYAAQ